MSSAAAAPTSCLQSALTALNQVIANSASDKKSADPYYSWDENKENIAPYSLQGLPSNHWVPATCSHANGDALVTNVGQVIFPVNNTLANNEFHDVPVADDWMSDQVLSCNFDLYNFSK